ncbi:apolipoprotein N-acyltransferase [Microbacterium amylolyticum]|uniref:Apolipoprotein N-acyltransferase n=1 Tax=Microbacterium amylolyticum TaxID=936337 RepID=A0ABS4ZDU5_9MICO|nr:apolipoprotein N-acyltransferase [Microbacterium amylolyticum]MBP2435461.1 apolipoprotein N-acyltransferase [Microbacterium amylolyticum]
MHQNSSVRPVLPLWAALVAAAAGGLALDASFPSLGIWPLAFVAVALGLVSLIGRSSVGAFFTGVAFGTCFYFPHVDWAASFLGDHPLRWIPWVALASVETVFTGLGAILIMLVYRWVPRAIADGPARIVVTALLSAGVWTTRELIMGSWPYGGFPWGRLGMSQAEGPLAPVASWTGVAGLTFVMVLVVTSTIEAVRVTARQPTARRSWLAPCWPAGLLVLLAVVPQFPTADAGSIRVGAVQGDGPAAYLDQREYLDVLNAQLRASAPIADDSVDVVLWPEGGVDADPLRNRDAMRELDGAVRQLGAPILLNAAMANGELIFNTSMLWTQDGPGEQHAKRYPVPFGEYVPQRELYARVVPSLIEMIQREYEPGRDEPVITVPTASGPVPIGLAICFDVLFDDLVWEGAHGGAQVYMFQTNNADFRGTDENQQQLAFARMRAIETGRSVVNISTVGTSQVISSDGTTTAEIPENEPGLIIADVELREGLTPAVVAGQGIRVALILLPLAGLIACGIRGRRMAPKASSGVSHHTST